MSKLFFFKKQKMIRSIQKKDRIQFVIQRLFLLGFLMLSIFNMMAQTAPNLSYASPQNYVLNATITSLSPLNSGGSIPGLTYKQVSTFAGTTSGFLDATGTAAKMNGPLGMTLDASGNVYFIDSANYRIRKMTSTGVVTTIAGDGYSFLFYGRLKNDAIGSLASFNYPSDLALDTTNNCLYVADKENDVIRKVSLTSPYAVTTLAGSGTSSTLDGVGTLATFKKPSGIVIDPSGTYLYVTDRAGNKIRRITISSVQVITIAGSGSQSTLDNATGTAATFNDPTGIAVDGNFIYISDFGGHKIRKISKTSPFAVTTLAGSGTSGSADNNTGTSATFNNPYGIALDPVGNLFVAEWGNKIRKITPSGVVTTIAGSGVGSSLDGNGAAATFDSPSNIIIDPNTGIAYISEWIGDRIRKIELTGYTISPPLPTGLIFNGATGIVSGSPTEKNYGPINYTITGYNCYGLSTATVAITTGTLPVLAATTTVTAITGTTATSGGYVTDNGISNAPPPDAGGSPTPLLERGICWSTSAFPTILNTKLADSVMMTGAFTSNLTGLTPLTTYYVRAYATTALGTSYGTQVSFTTLLGPPNINYPTTSTFIVGVSGTVVPTSTNAVVQVLAGVVSTFATLTTGCRQFVLSKDNDFFYAINTNNIIYKVDVITGVSTVFAGSGVAGTSDGTGTTAQFDGMVGIAVNKTTGNCYVIENGNGYRCRQITPNGVVTTITSSGLGYPNHYSGIDSNGNIYYINNSFSIGKIPCTNNSNTPTFGTPIPNWAGNYGAQAFLDGTGSAARFKQINGKIAFDLSNNLYVTDSNLIRKITPAAVVSTIAGNANQTTTVDGIGTNAFFTIESSFSYNALDNSLYGNDKNTLRKINLATLEVTTLFRYSNFSFQGRNLELFDGNVFGISFTNKITKIPFYGFSITPDLPPGIVLNADGSISGVYYEISAPIDYTITAVNGGGSFSDIINISVIPPLTITTSLTINLTANSTAILGNVSFDGGITVISKGICYATHPVPTIGDIAVDYSSGGIGSFLVELINLTANTNYYARAYIQNSEGVFYGDEVMFATLINAPNISYSTPNVFGVNTVITPLNPINSGGVIENFEGTVTTLLNNITSTSIAFDVSGNLYIADSDNSRILKMTAAGVLSVFAGGTYGYLDGFGTEAQFSQPRFITVDVSGNVYVSDLANYKIRKISPSGVVTTLAGTISGNQDGSNTTAQFNGLGGLDVDSFGNVFVCDYNSIRKITPSGDVTTFAGGTQGNQDGTGTDAQFYNPRSLVIDANNTLFVTDTFNFKIRKITSEGVVSTLAGGTLGIQDGTGTSAQFKVPVGITIDGSGIIYVTDFQSSNIRKITPTGVVTTIAGNGSFGYQDGALETSLFGDSFGLAMDSLGNLYVCDLGNQKIRKIILSFMGEYSISPDLPTGLTLNTDGSITGTPTVLTPATNYTITATNVGGSSTTTISLAVEETPTNEPPTASNQTLCQGALVSNLVAIGTSLKWYDVATGGVSLSTSTPLVSGTYYVSQTNGGVESARTAVLITLTNATTWTGTTSTSWNTASNWSCAVVPGVSSDVIITAATFAPVIVSDVAINSLTLNSGTTLTVTTGFDLTVTNSIHNSGTLTVQNNANLIQIDEVVNTGNIIVNRNSAPIVRLDHTLWSSPVTGTQTLQQFSPNTLSNRFYNYTTSSNSYTATPASSVFVAGKGFAVRAPNGQPTPAVAPFLGAVWSGSFTGIPNNGTITVALATDATNTFNYNLVGNPYPSAIDAKLLKESNPNIGTTLYFYQHTLTMNSSGLFDNGSTNYATWVYEAGNPAGGTGVGASTGNGHSPNVTPTRTIQVGQGFIVKAEGNNMTFTNSMRSGLNNTASFMKNTTFESNRLWLNLQSGSGASISDIIVGYVTGASNDIDQGYDGLSFGNTGSFLSSKIVTNDYVIQGRSLPFDSNDIVPLGFTADTAGTYSIYLTNKDGIFADTQDVYLKDDFTGTTHDIKASAYDFASNTGTFDARFSLIYTNALANNNTSFTSNSVVVFKPNQWFTINTNATIMKDVLVYDMAGRLIFQQSDINANTTVLKGLSPTNGVLLVKIVSNENEIVTVKVSN